MEEQISLQTHIGIVYGLYQFSTELARGFVQWLQSMEHPYGRCLCYAPGSCEFNALWLELAEQDYEEFCDLQLRYHEIILHS